MNLASAGKKVLDWIGKTYSNDIGNLLITTGVLGFGLSSGAQIIGIAKNNKIDKKEKTYMINQEVGDALINILSLFVFGKLTKHIGTKLVSTGKILPKTVATALEKGGLGDKIGKAGFDVIDTAVMKNPANAHLLKDFANCKNVIESFGAVGGSVLSGCLIAPILRNNYASYMQKSIHPTENRQFNRIDLSKYNTANISGMKI
ncbi:hypothetical protein IJI31_00345 [bacterium]|nr:hypothetical protein [bacterium]